MSEKVYYPIFTDVSDRACVVIGGGTIAERKVTRLLRCGAHVTVISLTLTRRLARAARRRAIRHVARPFRPADLRGAWLVIAATDDPRVNARVFHHATRRRIFTNVVDQKPLCSFIAPAILQRGPLTVAISTGGASPALAKQIRRDMERMVGDGYVPMLRLLASLRGEAKRTLSAATARRRYFDRVISGRVFELVRAGKGTEARRAATRLMVQSAAGMLCRNPRHWATGDPATGPLRRPQNQGDSPWARTAQGGAGAGPVAPAAIAWGVRQSRIDR